MSGVNVKKLVEKMELTVFTPHIDLEQVQIKKRDVNRPALQLNGYFEHFQEDRVQILGTVEYSFLQHMDPIKKDTIYHEFLSYKMPCVIFCRGFEPGEAFLRLANKNGIPCLGTKKETSAFMAELIYLLSFELAPCISIHGVLVDVYGEGVLIMGESGIGKSEAALELIRRGHRLVTDDVVEIRKINDRTLVGTSPEVTRYFIELRGIGIIDVKTMFGVESVKEKQNIDLVIKLEEWKKDKEYDRMGLEDEYMELLGNKVVCQSLPIRPGRNLAVICEAAAVNYRTKKMGYSAAHELYQRVQRNLGLNDDDCKDLEA
ncbi:MAG: HPr(Ser) kinase/phosphatase [Eubacterium sp.]|nr:HPr(Ser) kinase/phosphatase [Eubacterium sp.]